MSEYILTVADFVEGDVTLTDCPRCNRRVSVDTWDVDVSGIRHYAVMRWRCDCGHVWVSSTRVDPVWLLNRRYPDDRLRVVILHPHDHMDSEYYFWLAQGHDPVTWKEILAFELERTPHMREEAEYAFA